MMEAFNLTKEVLVYHWSTVPNKNAVYKSINTPMTSEQDVSLWEWSSERSSTLQDYSESFGIWHNPDQNDIYRASLCKHPWKLIGRFLKEYWGIWQAHFDSGMILRPSPSSYMVVEGFCDANWTSNPDDRRSISGFCIYLGYNLVFWQLRSNTLYLGPLLKLSTEVLHNWLLESLGSHHCSLS